MKRLSLILGMPAGVFRYIQSPDGAADTARRQPRDEVAEEFRLLIADAYTCEFRHARPIEDVR